MFIGTCVCNPFETLEELQEIIDSAVEINCKTFHLNIEIEETDLLRNMVIYSDDFIYYRYGEYYFFTHSAIEHFYKKEQ